MSLLIKNVLLNGETMDIRIRGSRIAAVAPSLKQEGRMRSSTGQTGRPYMGS